MFMCTCVCPFGIMISLLLYLQFVWKKSMVFPINVLNSVYSFVAFRLIISDMCISVICATKSTFFFTWCSHFRFFFPCISFNANCVDTLFKPNYPDIWDGRGTWLAKKETGNGGEKIQIERKKSPGHHTKH